MRADRGFALLFAVAALTLMAVAVLVVSEHLQVKFREFRLEERHVTLTALSDAVLAQTLARLSADSNFVGLDQRPLGKGFIASRIVQTPSGLRLVTGEATFGGWRARLEATIELSPGGPRVLDWKRSVGPEAPAHSLNQS